MRVKTPASGALEALVRAIARRDGPAAAQLLAAAPALAQEHLTVGAERTTARNWYFSSIEHYAYAGDTALHLAAAGYELKIARALLRLGAVVSARNRRGATPLHYACDGSPTLSTWDPRAQQAMVCALIEAGADPDATDRSGVAPLHRAVRTRSTGAVRALLTGGADPRLENGAGSTPRDLALGTTGRGGSGSPLAKAEARQILELLGEP